MKFFTITRERASEDWRRTDTYLIENNIQNPEQFFRNAIEEFMSTPEGKSAIEYACGDFNWGDAITYINEEILNKHGIYSVNSETENIIVNQDEVLYPGIQEEVLSK